jgi:hypothetical protein
MLTCRLKTIAKLGQPRPACSFGLYLLLFLTRGALLLELQLVLVLD